MKKIYLNHIPGNIHPVYQEILDHPPEGVEFINASSFGKNYQNNARKQEGLLFSCKNYLLSILKKVYFLPNITFRRLPGDIIYSCQSIPLLGEFILDIDCYEALNRFSNTISELALNKWIIRIFLRQKRCKKIIFWSDNAKKGFQAYLGNEFDCKMDILYPTVYINHTLEDIQDWKEQDRINILFVGRYFERKGGNIVLEVAKNITKKYSNVYFNFITQVDENILNTYKNNKQIHFLGLSPRDEVIKYFKKSDIYLMPTFQEIFGMVFLEALAYGAIPISMNTFAIDNIISNGDDGFIVDYHNKFHKENFQYIDKYNENIDLLLDIIDKEEKDEIINKLIEKIEFLIINRDEMAKMREKGFEKVKNGKFSTEIRNQQLSDILYH